MPEILVAPHRLERHRLSALGTKVPQQKREQPANTRELSRSSYPPGISHLTLLYVARCTTRTDAKKGTSHQNSIPHPPRVLVRQQTVILEVRVSLHRPCLPFRSHFLLENVSTVSDGHGHAGVLREADEVEVVRVGQVALLYSFREGERQAQGGLSVVRGRADAVRANGLGLQKGQVADTSDDYNTTAAHTHSNGRAEKPGLLGFVFVSELNCKESHDKCARAT